MTAITASLVETEYIALASTNKKTVWLCTLLEKLDFTQTTTTIINTDNQDCIVFVHNSVGYSCAKHIDIWHYFIWEHIKWKEIVFYYTKKILANIFTKALSYEIFIKFQVRLGIFASSMISC